MLITYTSNVLLVILHKTQQYELLETLDSKYRLVVLLYYMEGFSVREISDALDMKESTVKSRLHRGRKQIAEMYGYKVKEGRV